MKTMKRMTNKALPYIGTLVMALGIIVCYMAAAYSDQGGSLSLVAVSCTKGIVIALIGLLLNRWRV